MFDRVPPNDEAAEVQVLGAALFHPDGAAKALEMLRPTDFYVPAHADIFKAMRELADGGKPVDMVTVASHLRMAGKLEAVGGAAYVAGLANDCYTAANVEHHAAVVRERSSRRDLLRAAAKLAELAYDDAAPLATALEQAERQVVAIGSRQVVGDMRKVGGIVGTVYQTLEDRTDGTAPEGVMIGLADVDAMIGGFKPGQLIILAARPAMGKSALAMNVAVHVAKTNRPVAVFSLEMDGESLTERLLAAEAKIGGTRLKHGYIYDDDWQVLAQATGRLGGLPLFIDDAPGATLATMRAKARRLQMQEGAIGLIVVDYLQLLESGGRDDSRVQEISKFSRGLKLMSREFRCPVLALSQLNRAVEQRPNKRPQLSDLRDSGSIEQDADLVLFIYRDEYYNPNGDHRGKAEIIIGKQRSGPTGTVTVAFDKEQTRFHTATLEVTA